MPLNSSPDACQKFARELNRAADRRCVHSVVAMRQSDHAGRCPRCRRRVAGLLRLHAAFSDPWTHTPRRTGVLSSRRSLATAAMVLVLTVLSIPGRRATPPEARTPRALVDRSGSTAPRTSTAASGLHPVLGTMPIVTLSRTLQPIWTATVSPQRWLEAAAWTRAVLPRVTPPDEMPSSTA